MSVRRVNLYGPPGSGKTRKLAAAFLAMAEVTPPDRIGAVTFTRAGAYELRGRLAKQLGIVGGPVTQRRRLPWVGTIHSLCFGLLGLSTANIAKLSDFATDLDLERPQRKEWVSEEPDAPYADWDTGRRQVACEVMAEFLSKRNHRKLSDDDALRMLDDEKIGLVGGERAILDLAALYADWKREQALYDYDDLLLEGQKIPLPVKGLLIDEAQDNSPLLWDVLDAWGANTEITIAAGDPFQSVYQFSGGAPELFFKRAGVWKTIGDSHRFDQEAARYAGRILWDVWRDDPDAPRVREMLDSWRGVGGTPQDGTTMILARTRRLLDPIRHDLMDEGVPFRALGGTGPLDTVAGSAYRTWHRLAGGQVVPAREAAQMVKAASGAPWRRQAQMLFSRQAKDMPSRDTTQEDVLALLVYPQWDHVRTNIAYYDYFGQIVARDPKGLFLTPKLALGSIHSSKGLEADTVQLVRSWASRPARRALEDTEGAQEEACVAFVGATRHRVALEWRDAWEGIEYPWP